MYDNNDHSLDKGFQPVLPVAWLETGGPLPVPIARCPGKGGSAWPEGAGYWPTVAPWTGPSGGGARRERFSHRAFTILEMMIVIGIIGLMAAVALPHLGGFTQGNTITGATRQMLDDVGLARQRAIANRSEVCMVFLPPNFWTNTYINGQNAYYSNSQVGNLVGHQYTAYALISTRTVGDQPGKSNMHYLSDWKYLPQGVYFYPWQLTNGYGLNLISTTNTVPNAGAPPLSNNFFVSCFSNDIKFPFPSTYSPASNGLPYIAFNSAGQLISGADQYIALSLGSVFVPPDASGNPQWALNGASVVETPMGNVSNNANLIHIDWVTGRAKLERNSF
jgi:prepilin-type N-terminal cleavage/methylation domain-containing protein